MRKTALIVLFAVFAAGCGWIKGGDRTPPPVRLYNDRQQKTPAGAVVASRDGVNPAFLAAVDAELTRVFDDARREFGYQFGLAYNQYVIYALPPSDCRPSPVYGTRSFEVNGILAAEWVADPERGAYVVCYAPVPDQDLRNALRYGPEHIIFWRNDQERFRNTADPCCHQHPLIAEGPQ